MRAIMIGRRNILVIVFVFFISFMFQIPSISAATWDIFATSVNPDNQSNFSFRCVDTNNDGVLTLKDGIGEVPTNFTGVWESYSGSYDTIETFPDQAMGPVSTSDGTPTVVTSWKFSRLSGGQNLSIGAINWTYSITVVPIPGAVWLLGSGLIGIVGIRRKFKK